LPSCGEGRSAAEGPAPQRTIDDLPQKVRHLGGIIQNLQNAAGDGDENSPEEKLLAKTIDQMFQQFGRLQDLVFATPVKAGDTAALRARAEVAQFWCAGEIALCPPATNSEASMLGELIRAIFAYCEVDKSIAQANSV
jgi:hypothetical protein